MKITDRINPEKARHRTGAILISLLLVDVELAHTEPKRLRGLGECPIKAFII